ncbi:MAG: glycosyltransferase family 39 protein [Anaerolineaceae bacterium]|nr:glycosyltransferase family 39 protein [Anaerolineaceae bacterium]
MQTIPTQPSTTKQTWLKRRLVYRITPAMLILFAIMLLSAGLHFYNISAIGDANDYYTAAVKSMLQSWHNFFFVAAEPGGSVSIDKPPLGLWIETAFAAVLGVKGWVVSLPNILAGIFSIPLLYNMVRKHTNEVAGLVAGLVMAITPIFVATNRNNTMDGMLVFTLLLAAWAFIKASERGSLKWLLLGGILVGLGFNIKMMQAFLPLPAFYALYFFAAKIPWGRKLFHLVLTTVLLLVVSFAWVVAVDLTPADQRPYIGSSDNNTVMGLIFGHNGISRLEGKAKANSDGPQDAKSIPNNFALQNNTPQPNNERKPLPAAIDACIDANIDESCSFELPNGQSINGLCIHSAAQTTLICARPDRPMQPQPQPNNAIDDRSGGTAFSSETGQPGILRFFTAPLSKQMSWLLPFALISILLALFSARIRFPIQSRVHHALILWGGWLMTCLIFFSMVSGIFHAYYTIMLVPALAATVGIGFSIFCKLSKHHTWATVGLILATSITIAYQLYAVWSYGENAVLLLGSLVLLVIGIFSQFSLFVKKRLACVILLAAMLVIPLFWTVKTISTTENQNLPTAYSGSLQNQRPNPGEALPENNKVSDLLSFLENNTQEMKYLAAVPSSNQKGSELVLATGRPVLFMGGFNGADDVVSVDDLSSMVSADELRYIFSGGDKNNKADISIWLQSTCTVIPEFSENANINKSNNNTGPRGDSLTLYDCQ